MLLLQEYTWINDSSNLIIDNEDVSILNSYMGGSFRPPSALGRVKTEDDASSSTLSSRSLSTSHLGRLYVVFLPSLTCKDVINLLLLPFDHLQPLPTRTATSTRAVSPPNRASRCTDLSTRPGRTATSSGSTTESRRGRSRLLAWDPTQTLRYLLDRSLPSPW